MKYGVWVKSKEDSKSFFLSSTFQTKVIYNKKKKEIEEAALNHSTGFTVKDVWTCFNKRSPRTQVSF